MSGLIPQPFIDDLLDRTDIVEIIDSRVKLKKSGKNYAACCPFHDEKTPSFTVSPDKQFYYCFGCGASGNAVGFVMDYDRLGFPDAIESLARHCGLEVPKESRERSSKEQSRKNIYSLLEKSADFYRQQLRTHSSRQTAVNYLKGRGLSGEIARDFGIGYAPPGWDNLLKALGTTPKDKQQLVEGGMIISREEDNRLYDRFRTRIMFPIHDVRGRVIGFGGRVLNNDKPKYLNSPETPVFHKGRELYGLYEARQFNRQLPRLLMVEGYMDVVALAQFDIRYAVATLGTACGEEHLKLAFRYTQEIVFCFDGDNAGRRAAQRALESALPAMEDGRQVKFLFLPDGEDPDSLIRQVGSEKFNRKIELALPLEEFLFDRLSDGIDIQSMEGRARLSKLAAPLLDRLPKGVFRELMFNNLANRTGLSPQTLIDLVEETRKTPATDNPLRDPASTPDRQSTATAPTKTAALHTAEAGNTPASEDPGRMRSEKPAEHLLPATNTEVLTPEQAATQHYEQLQHEQQAASAAERHYLSGQLRASRQGQFKLPPQKLLSSLLLQYPEFADIAGETEELHKLNDPDIDLFIELLELFQQRPNYSISRVLGYWRATYGEQATSNLATLAASQLLISAKQLAPFNAKGEFEDTLSKIRLWVEDQKYDAILDKLKNKALDEFSDEEKRQYKDAVAYKSATQRKPSR